MNAKHMWTASRIIAKRLGVIASVSAASLLLILSSQPAYAFTPTVTEFDTAQVNDEPFGITAGPDGNLWYVERGNDTISKMSTSGVNLATYTLPNTPVPFDITVGSDNNLWFTDYGNNAIGKITTSGTVTEYTIPTNSSNVHRLTLGPDGNIWFTEHSAAKIGKITPAGTITEYSNGGVGLGDDSITAGPDGNLWFTGHSSNKVSSITTSGTVTEYTITAGAVTPQSLAFDSTGNLWFNEYSKAKIGRRTSAGVFAEFTTPSSSVYAFGMKQGPDGRVWFTDPSADKVTRINYDGSVTEYSAPSGSGVSGVTAGPDGNIWYTSQSTHKVGRVTLPPKPGLPAVKTAVVTAGKSTEIEVLAGISGNPDAATLSIVNGPSHGTAVDPPSTITYTPNAGFTGSDSLTYRVCSADNDGICSQGVLGLTVVAATGAPATGYISSTNEHILPLVLGGVSGLLCIAGLVLWRKNSSTSKPKEVNQ